MGPRYGTGCVPPPCLITGGGVSGYGRRGVLTQADNRFGPKKEKKILHFLGPVLNLNGFECQKSTFRGLCKVENFQIFLR